jgi:hypothetical protein
MWSSQENEKGLVFHSNSTVLYIFRRPNLLQDSFHSVLVNRALPPAPQRYVSTYCTYWVHQYIPFGLRKGTYVIRSSVTPVETQNVTQIWWENNTTESIAPSL